MSRRACATVGAMLLVAVAGAGCGADAGDAARTASARPEGPRVPRDSSAAAARWIAVLSVDGMT